MTTIKNNLNKLFQIILEIAEEIFSNLTRKSQPYLKNTKNKKLINYWWSEVFYNKNNNNLKTLANNSCLNPRPGHGLIYYYIVKNQVRYIGQTRERSLHWRMTKRQANSNTIGYSYSIKRQMLNAYRAKTLQIKTQEVRISDLNQIEESEIKRYSQSNRLWNIEHNSRYTKYNRWS